MTEQMNGGTQSRFCMEYEDGVRPRMVGLWIDIICGLSLWSDCSSAVFVDGDQIEM